MNREEFIAEFGSRTAAYIDGVALDNRPVVVAISAQAHTPAGHLLATGLVNQLARAHSQLVIVGDLRRPLLCRQPFDFDDLEQATAGLARAINPHIEVETASADRSGERLLTIAVGDGEHSADLEVGCEGWCALFGAGSAIVDQPESIWGAALASCLAGAFAFHRMMGNRFELAARHSLWEGGAAGNGQGPTLTGPLDLGRVLQVGVGAVGSAVDYWLSAVGVKGQWLLVDDDLVDASNLNRQMLFLARHVGYPDGEAERKAEIAAAFLDCEARISRWGQDPYLVEREYDLVLALANEDGVRSALQRRQPPLLLHATTSANWQAQTHRHIRGRDDCIDCRLPAQAPQLRCSSGEIGEEPGTDAALPFLSAAAGLLLARDLVRLAEGELAAADGNFLALDLGGEAPVVQSLHHHCRADCGTWLPTQLRRVIAAGTRFASLDADR